jgi:hypothetical protein
MLIYAHIPTQQSQISEILTSADFYSKLLGDTWLFFQVEEYLFERAMRRIFV